jgi:hypothetical protein
VREGEEMVLVCDSLLVRDHGTPHISLSLFSQVESSHRTPHTAHRTITKYIHNKFSRQCNLISLDY